MRKPDFLMYSENASGISYENASGIFMRRAWCEMHHACFHFLYVCLKENHVIFLIRKYRLFSIARWG